MPQLTMDDRVVVAADVVHRKIGEETVLIGMDAGIYYGLDTMGTFIWKCLVEDGRLRFAYDRVLAEYEVGPEQLARDLLDLVEELRTQGLVELVAGGAAGSV
jgi:hypothetical protein